MNENDMKRMQQEAMRRAKEMQSRAKFDSQAPQDSSENSRKENQNPSEQKHEAPHSNTPIKYHTENNHRSENVVDSVFDVLMKDRDRTLILCLILILMDEKADNSLILALLYLLI